MTGTRELDARPARLDVVSSADAPTEATPTGAALPAVKGKLRGYGTVRQLSEAADLVVRGEVETTGFRADEVLRATNGSAVGAGTRTAPTGCRPRAHCSR
ncbi:hypothetical protein ACLQ3A_16495 [Micromonospora zamorensis]|uniref:hypothetical protein n=1 Tax=Micromonospora zamorensis TaxID=709883 RepID=UPI00386FC398|nr:hypothetical protein OHA01_04240 [Micromonospora zamorensis]